MSLKRLVGLAGIIGATVLLGAACDEPGSGSQAIVPVDTRNEVASDIAETVGDAADATVEVVPDTVVAETVLDTVVPDTATPETVAPETTTSICEQGCLPINTAGAPTGVVFRQFGDQVRPTLRGGNAPTGTWVLGIVSIYSQGTFAEGIEVTFSDHGATAGRIAFNGDAIGMALDLDLDVTVSAFGSTGSDSARSPVSLGGCHEVDGTRLRGNFGACGAGLESEESAIDFELTASALVVGVEVSREALIALLPPDQQSAGDLAIVGPMYLVASFERP